MELGDEVLIHVARIMKLTVPTLSFTARGLARVSLVRNQPSLVIFRVSNPGDPAETSVYLGHMKKYPDPTLFRVPDLEALDERF